MSLTSIHPGTATSGLANIQILRGVAAMMVVLVHASEQFASGFMLFPTGFGNAGVDIFFVISGFIMVHASAVRPRGPVAFLRDRWLRIAPMYWMFSTLTVVLVLAMPSAFRGTVFDPMHTLMSYLFVPWPHPVNVGSLSPILRVGWTLNYEMFFYVIFALAIAIRPALRAHIALAVIGALVVAGTLLPGPAAWGFYTRDIMLEFGFGMLLALAWQRGLLSPLPAVVGWGLLLTGATMLVLIGAGVDPDMAARSLWFGLPACAIVAGALVLEQPRTEKKAVLLLLGNASYALYLSHPFVLTACRIVFAQLGITGETLVGNTLGVVAMVTVACLCGILCHLWLERPLQAFLRGPARVGPA